MNNPKDLSYEQWKAEMQKANSPAKQGLIQAAEKQYFELKSQYNRGLITPLDFAEQAYMIWSSCEQKLRWGKE